MPFAVVRIQLKKKIKRFVYASLLTLFFFSLYTKKKVVNGNAGVARSMVSEITDDTNKAKAFATFGFSYGMGIIGKYNSSTYVRCKGKVGVLIDFFTLYV